MCKDGHNGITDIDLGAMVAESRVSGGKLFHLFGPMLSQATFSCEFENVVHANFHQSSALTARRGPFPRPTILLE